MHSLLPVLRWILGYFFVVGLALALLAIAVYGVQVPARDRYKQFTEREEGEK